MAELGTVEVSRTTKKTEEKKRPAKVKAKAKSKAKAITTKTKGSVKAKTTSKGKAKTTSKAKTTKKAISKATSKKSTGTRGTKKDDLKKIEGIGPKIEQLLHKAKITTFKELSNTKVGVLREILQKAGSRFKMHDPSTWARQSKLAASNKWDQLKKLQDELDGGRKK